MSLMSKKILISLLCFTMISLSGCSTRVSTKLLPGMEYRENPVIRVVEYTNKKQLQEACYVVLKSTLNWVRPYKGCAYIPYNPDSTCIVYVMRGDTETLEHEIAHCHGYADTYWW